MPDVFSIANQGAQAPWETVGGKCMLSEEFYAPATVEQALSLLSRGGGEATVLAGGTDLLPRINSYKLKPRAVVYLGRVGLDYCNLEGERVVIGATCTTARLASDGLLEEAAPILVEAARRSASPAVRNAATMGGNLVSAHPGADLAVPLLALEATVHLAGPEGETSLPLSRLFLGRRRTALGPGRLLTGVSFARAPGGWSFLKLGRRRANTLAVVNAAVLLDVFQGVYRGVRIALGCMGPCPQRCPEAEALLEGAAWSPALVEEAVDRAMAETNPESDSHASAWYRQRAARALLGRALAQAGERSAAAGHGARRAASPGV